MFFKNYQSKICFRPASFFIILLNSNNDALKKIAALYCLSIVIRLDLSLISQGVTDYLIVKRLQHLLFLAFLVSLTGFGGELMAKTNDALLSCITESRESKEAEEEGNQHHSFESRGVKQMGAGGSDLEDIEVDRLPSNPLPFVSSFQALPLYFCYQSISLKVYHTLLFSKFYLPKLFILFHCQKSFLA